MIDTKLITFITVAQTKNFTKAANILNMTQPAISQHIKAIEDYYNIKLFYKKNKHMELTEEGKFLYENSLKLEAMSKFIKNQLHNKSSIVKRYDIGATLTIGGYILPKIMADYKKCNKNRDIILHVENTDTIIKKLLHKDIDLGVIEGPFDKLKVKYTKFKEDELVLAVSCEHPFTNKEFVTIEDVLYDKLILREKGSGTREVFEQYILKEGYKLDSKNIYMEVCNIPAIVSLVASGLGVTIISKEAIKYPINNNMLKIIPIENLKMTREFNFIFLDEKDEEFVNSFINFCNVESK